MKSYHALLLTISGILGDFLSLFTPAHISYVVSCMSVVALTLSIAYYFHMFYKFIRNHFFKNS